MIPDELKQMRFLGDGIVGEASEEDIHKFGREVDLAFSRLATNTNAFCRDEVALAYLALVESTVYSAGWKNVRLDSLVPPFLDHILPNYPDRSPATDFGMGAVTTVGPLMRRSLDHDFLISGVISFLQGHMKCAITDRGRFIFYPVSSFATELRNRWFDQRWAMAREAIGRGRILEDNISTREILRKIDVWVESQDQNLQVNAVCAIPDDQWYRAHAEGIADRVLQLQFQHVVDTESWAGFTKDQLMQAIRPLYLRAALRALVHYRVFAYLKHHYSAQTPLLKSVIDQTSIEQLASECAEAAKMQLKDAREFVRSMLRTGTEERYRLFSYPLIPLSGDRVALLPSVILFEAWPALREKAAMKTKGGQNSVSRARNRRHTQSLLDAAAAAGFRHATKEVLLVDPATKQSITDLDVVLVDDKCDRVLVVQLKSFLTPSNMLEIDRANQDVRDACDQCARADAHREIVRVTLEQELGIHLAEDWVMRQLIAVEANTGTEESSEKYPVVSLEWLESKLRETQPRPVIDALWQAARDLPDGEMFFQSIAPAFQLLDDHFRHLKVERTAAVFVYGSTPRYQTK